MAPRNPILWFFLAIFLASCFMAGWLLLPFLSIIVVASVVTGVFKPLYLRLEKKARPAVASFATCVVVCLVLFIPIVLFVGIVSREAYEMYLMARSALFREHIQELIAGSRLFEHGGRVLAGVNIGFAGEVLDRAIPEIGKIVGLFLYEQANAIASNIIRFLVNFFFMLLVVYFLLIDGGRLVDFLIDLSPLPDEQDEKLIDKFKDMVGAILLGNGLCGILQGVIGGLAFALAGIQSSFLWGVIMAIVAFLPIVGVGMVFVPAAAYLMLKGRVVTGIGMFLFYVMLSGGFEYIFKPRLVGKRVQMHTLLVFFSIVGGLRLFGILGILYGPLVVTAFLTLTEIYHSSYQMMVEAEGDGGPGAGAGLIYGITESKNRK